MLFPYLIWLGHQWIGVMGTSADADWDRDRDLQFIKAIETDQFYYDLR